MTKTALQATATKKVLVVEDEGEMCLLLNLLLDGDEMRLEHVSNLLAAYEYLKKELPLLSSTINFPMVSELILSTLLKRIILLLRSL